jgi:hypothetical protein
MPMPSAASRDARAALRAAARACYAAPRDATRTRARRDMILFLFSFHYFELRDIRHIFMPFLYFSFISIIFDIFAISMPFRREDDARGAYAAGAALPRARHAAVLMLCRCASALYAALF